MNDPPYLAALQEILHQHVRAAAVKLRIVLLPEEDKVARPAAGLDSWCRQLWRTLAIGEIDAGMIVKLRQRLGDLTDGFGVGVMRLVNGEMESRRIHRIA